MNPVPGRSIFLRRSVGALPTANLADGSAGTEHTFYYFPPGHRETYRWLQPPKICHNRRKETHITVCLARSDSGGRMPRFRTLLRAAPECIPAVPAERTRCFG